MWLWIRRTVPTKTKESGFNTLSNEEYSFSRDWDKKHITQIALFDPLIQRYRLAFDDKFGHKTKPKVTPLENAIEEYNESEEKLLNFIATQDDTKIINSRLIDDLNETCKRALKDYRESFEVQYDEGDIVRSLYVDRKRQDFFENGIKRYAFELEKIFEGLISYDGYPKKVFRNYKQIKRLIDNTQGKTSAMYLRQLIIVGEQLIPTSVRLEHPEVIESNNSYSDSVDEG